MRIVKCINFPRNAVAVTMGHAKFRVVHSWCTPPIILNVNDVTHMLRMKNVPMRVKAKSLADMGWARLCFRVQGIKNQEQNKPRRW